MRKYAKEEKILRQIQGWEKKHLRSHTKVNYGLTADLLKAGELNTDFRKYIVTKEYAYHSDTSRTFPLGAYGEHVLSWMTQSCTLIDVFHERCAMRGRLDKTLREDTLFDRMEQVFYGIMAQLLHAVNFFQYDRIANAAYREPAEGQILRLLNRADQLLEYYGTYISLQGASAFYDSSEEIGNIQIAVDSMQQALRESGR